MKKNIVATVMLSAAVASLTATPAATAGVPVPGPAGFLCGLTAVTDPAGSAADMAGAIYAGPATTAVAGTLICTVQVNSGAHDGVDVASREFPSDSNGVIVGMQTVAYATQEHAQVYLCTSFRNANGTVIYFSSDIVARWHTDPSKECSAVTQAGTQDVWDIVDAALCPELAVDNGWHGHGNSYIDKEGDVFVDANVNGIHEVERDSSDAMADLFYDCPVYTSTIDSSDNPDQLHDAATNLPATNEVIDW